jgi:hypothetical protein
MKKTTEIIAEINNKAVYFFSMIIKLYLKNYGTVNINSG